MTSRQLDEEAIFHVARQFDSPQARADYLDQVSPAISALAQRVEALLTVHEREQIFLEIRRPAGTDSGCRAGDRDARPADRSL